MNSRDPHAMLRLQRGAQHLYVLGPRAVAEFLAEIAERTEHWQTIFAALQQYERRLTPAMLSASGGDHFPPLPIRQVA